MIRIGDKVTIKTYRKDIGAGVVKAINYTKYLMMLGYPGVEAIVMSNSFFVFL